jgi:hypothetical protein
MKSGAQAKALGEKFHTYGILLKNLHNVPEGDRPAVIATARLRPFSTDSGAQRVQRVFS